MNFSKAWSSIPLLWKERPSSLFDSVFSSRAADFLPKEMNSRDTAVKYPRMRSSEGEKSMIQYPDVKKRTAHVIQMGRRERAVKRAPTFRPTLGRMKETKMPK